jgi:hypothetical protein
MSTSQIIAVNGAAQQSNAISSTKVKVASSVPFYYAVGSDPTASPTFANTRMIPANVITSINMEGLGNKISVIFAGTTGNVSITTVGTVKN